MVVAKLLEKRQSEIEAEVSLQCGWNVLEARPIPRWPLTPLVAHCLFPSVARQRGQPLFSLLHRVLVNLGWGGDWRAL